MKAKSALLLFGFGAFVVWFGVFGLVSMLAHAGVLMQPDHADPSLDRIYPLALTFKSGVRSGFVKPWIGRTYVWMRPASIALAAAFFAFCFGAVIWRSLQRRTEAVVNR